MALGAGKYDALATYVREQAKADGVVVLVFGGTHGDGIQIQADVFTTLGLPKFLEHLAAAIRRDLTATGGPLSGPAS
jgi:hypothetical protein